ncbi:hypothetical protein AN8646.2 [Aspergillus nidulans FGSC A4]|uniref:Alcohol dehydrogenase-like N-terminal domain-containing protein n=1 Tax=Emericella nidulans (strain FGSC A4 / ATCC 38163 / CBS 112.46 / NRRL 194 / M139) TaxID=227321 RepID=Q5AST4_EMENI|nr:hypothetical protein [Aspergillus nidulans FGSC A4]EAA60680.1 hypothetical protein AN8646.2 [Aspergillus nidulans FGSC A4]CBF78265.1 TPA: conserved hypothetical protein [Aspergillus nidulans FGSC A4]|eukprot:XP_681915.1 hypothetical protein AN8646.2 [Aspergillus nidulans FGSC A4]
MSTQITSRRVFRRTDDDTPGTPRVQLLTEALPVLSPTSVLIQVYAVALNYRDANIANGRNPWPVTPHGIPCNDAAGGIIARGKNVKSISVGGRVAPIIDTENITGREPTRSWLAADEHNVLADYIVFDECKHSSQIPPLLTVNYATHPEWHEEVLKLTDGRRPGRRRWWEQFARQEYEMNPSRQDNQPSGVSE